MDTSNLIIIITIIFVLSCSSSVSILFTSGYIYKEYIMIKTLTSEQTELSKKATEKLALET